MSNGAAPGQPAYIELYSGWATTRNGGLLYGRVHKGEPPPLPEAGDGLARRIHESIQDLDLRALANAQVRLSGFHGAGPATADGNGFVKVPLPDGMPQGPVTVTAQLETPDFTADAAATTLQVWDVTDPPRGVISDIDDTLTDTDITRKVDALKNTFFENTYDVKVFPNAPQAVALVAGKDASLRPTLPVFYLSGSPWALHERISGAFDLHGLPHGATILRRYSQESLDPYYFKLPHLLEIVDHFPGCEWILFGDTGEKDPEVYRTLMQERPGTVDAVFIHNVTKADPLDSRYEGFTVFSDWSEVLGAIPQRQLGL